MKYIMIFMFIFVLGGCSFKQEPNRWQTDASKQMQLYVEHFLSANDYVAQRIYKKAKNNAKKSAQLETLARVYLVKCAMHLTVGLSVECDEYTKIQNIVSSDELDAYYMFLNQTITLDQVVYLDPRYRSFANSLLVEATDIVKQMHQIDDTVSKLLVASMIRDYLAIKDVDDIISIASYHGYKKASEFWLLFKYENFQDDRALQILKIIQEV